MSTLEFGLATAAYYALHSLLAADFAKTALPMRWYRLAYNVLATVLLASLVFLYFASERPPLWSPNKLLPYPGGLLALAGLVWVVRALAGYDLGEFTGLQQLRTTERPDQSKLNIGGLNARVRHPLYFGTLLIVWGLFFVLPTGAMLVFAAVSTAYLIVGSILEERKLVAQFGEAYRKYQRMVPMLVPFKWQFR